MRARLGGNPGTIGYRSVSFLRMNCNLDNLVGADAYIGPFGTEQ